MTREEAIKRIDEQYKICEEFYYLSANPEKGGWARCVFVPGMPEKAVERVCQNPKAE